MSNTVITNYTDLNGPSTKAESSVVVIVNKDGSLSVDKNLLGTLMGTDGTQGAISVVRVGHEGKPDDATDSETEDDKVQHVTLSVDSYYNEPNSIIKYDSGAEMLQSLRIETRENSLIGFQNDHCYTSLTSPSQELQNKNDNQTSYDESVIEITQAPMPTPPPPKTVPSSKKITILEQQIIPKGKKIIINPTEPPIILKGNDVLSKTLPVIKKAKDGKALNKISIGKKPEESIESSSISSSGESIPDRDSDSDYKDTKDKGNIGIKPRKNRLKPRILKAVPQSKPLKAEPKVVTKLKGHRSLTKKEIKDRSIPQKKILPEQNDAEIDLESLLPSSKISTNMDPKESSKPLPKTTPKPVKKEKKTPAHVSALLSDMTSLFSTPDVIRRVSTDGKTNSKDTFTDKKFDNENKDSSKLIETADQHKNVPMPLKSPLPKGKERILKSGEKNAKSFDPIPQLDDVSLAQILQDSTPITSNVTKQAVITTASSMNSPGLPGPLSPTLDLLGGLGALQPEEEGLSEDLLMHVAQLVESSENLQEVIDKQVLGKVDTVPVKTAQSPFQQAQGSGNLYTQTLSKTVQKNINLQRKEQPIEIIRKDGRVITLPPIEAPATRSSKRKSQMDTSIPEIPIPPTPQPMSVTPEPRVQTISKQYVNKKLTNKKHEQVEYVEKIAAESQESWNSEDDPNRLWCICKQPHNNRFMICCDSCEDWFHGKCVNITKAMGQQMEDQGIEWRCPNCIKKIKVPPKTVTKTPIPQKKDIIETPLSVASPTNEPSSKTNCIVCKQNARASSIYCSDACILKHAQDSLGSPTTGKLEAGPGKVLDQTKSESRVIVYERKSGRLLAGPNAPTAENLKAWLQKNPTFEVVRPGTLSTLKPNPVKKKPTTETNKIQTTLNFERIPRKNTEQQAKPQTEVKDKVAKPLPSPKEETKIPPRPKTPATPKVQHMPIVDTPRASTSSSRPVSEPRKASRHMLNRSHSNVEKAASVTPSTSRRKEGSETKRRMNSNDSIRDNVRKSLQEQLSARMAENKGTKFTEEEIEQFAWDTEDELHDLFRDVGMKYKAKYRSLMFNIKDRKNLTLWEKICDKSIGPKQLVRLSPEELASQELAEWRDQEAKHQLELIKKSELDLLAASKTYVLKTHKGEEVMETKESVSTELDPNVPVEDVVSVLNDTINEEPAKEKQKTPDLPRKSSTDKKSSRKRERENSSSSQIKKSRRDSRRDSEKKSRSSRRRRTDSYEKESRDGQRKSSRRTDKRAARSRSVSKDRTKTEKDKPGVRSRSRQQSRSREKSRRRSKSRVRSRSGSKTRDRSPARNQGLRSTRRSRSKSISKRRHSSRSKWNSSIDEKPHLRSRSQENISSKNKNDSTDSDSVERPKSATLKEVHPEYDPHEPMITSAFSDEDLRKSREDVYDDSYKADISESTEYDPSKLGIGSEMIMPSTTFLQKQDKLSEGESDQEPSSTVDTIPTNTVWNGCINMVDVARFYVAAHEVSGSAVDLEEDLPSELDIVGRINPDTVWEYIAKMKKASNKDIIVLRLQAANDEEKMQYIALYSYLSSRKRLGVVKVTNTTTVKDFYIVPLAGNAALPDVLALARGALADRRTHLLLAIVIRQRRKRAPPPHHVVTRESHKRSYTPPASPRLRAALPLPSYTSSPLSTTVKDKIAASLATDDDEAYSPGSSSSNGSTTLAAASSSNTLRSKMEELNRQIEEQKQQIRKIVQGTSSAGEDEAYSPSRPMTPPPIAPVPSVDTLADIALPSNLQEILATIKQRSETANTGDVDMRTMPMS